MKSVLISIQPKWCELIANGKKTVEVRKTKPKLETPFKVYIYCTANKQGTHDLLEIHGTDGKIRKANGKVIGEFVCERIDRIGKRGIPNNFDYCYLSLNEWGNDDIEIEITDIKKSCISKEELNLYGEKTNCLYAWHISDLVLYDKPKELNRFQKPCIRDCDCGGCENAYYTRDYGFEGCALEEGLTRPPQSWCYVEELGGG